MECVRGRMPFACHRLTTLGLESSIDERPLVLDFSLTTIHQECVKIKLFKSTNQQYLVSNLFLACDRGWMMLKGPENILISPYFLLTSDGGRKIPSLMMAKACLSVVPKPLLSL